MRLILASASPRRAELLRAAGYSFDVVVANVDESIRAGETPATYVRRLAAEKSLAAITSMAALKGCATTGAASSASNVAQAFPPPLGSDTPELRRGSPKPLGEGGRLADVVVLGADTTVVVDGAILGKPCNDDEGRDMLRRLSGKTHQVLTGVSLRQGAFEVGRVETTSVTFRVLTDEDISAYVASGEGRDKAGGYAIQGLASRFIPAIAGSYANVVGLPVACVDDLLRSLLASGR